jgi:hypothetical protein
LTGFLARSTAYKGARQDLPASFMLLVANVCHVSFQVKTFQECALSHCWVSTARSPFLVVPSTLLVKQLQSTKDNKNPQLFSKKRDESMDPKAATSTHTTNTEAEETDRHLNRNRTLNRGSTCKTGDSLHYNSHGSSA